MRIVLLSGGSGSRLWPLSNDARSKQFLRLLPGPGGEPESMVQRMVRQVSEADVRAGRSATPVTVATSAPQVDAILSQLGDSVTTVTEPSRRKTFPAICLAAAWLASEQGTGRDETVIALPCDAYAGPDYFDTLARMAAALDESGANLVVMGIQPTYPSAKYGYILPAAPEESRVEGSGVRDSEGWRPVARFVEKPPVAEAEGLIREGARWNAGVFAFRLGYLLDLVAAYIPDPTADRVRDNYDKLPAISFDREVAEALDSIVMVPYDGDWKDLGTWNTLTDELPHTLHGNVLTDGSGQNTHVLNELDIPLVCIGTRDLVVAASPDGILVTEKSKSETVKGFAPALKERPMYEERRWGVYRVIDRTESTDGFQSLTKRLTLRPGASISYQRHAHRSEVWTFIEGEGEIVLDADRRPVKRGDTIVIPAGTMHALRATTPLTFIEVQSGGPLIEEDIERFPYNWDEKT